MRRVYSQFYFNCNKQNLFIIFFHKIPKENTNPHSSVLYLYSLCYNNRNIITQHKMNLDKQGMEMGSPRNITVNTLYGNKFFTLDYQGKQAMSRTVVDGHYNAMKRIKQTNNHSHNQKNPLSAQFSRSTNMKHQSPFTRIKRVNEIISRLKKRDQVAEQLQIRHEKAILSLPKTKIKLDKPETTMPKTQRKYLLDTIAIDESIDNKISRKTLNQFQYNYKNRRKLADKIYKKSPLHLSPMVISSYRSDSHKKKEVPKNTTTKKEYSQSLHGANVKFEAIGSVAYRYN